MTVRLETDNGTSGHSAKFDIREDGPGVAGEVVLEVYSLGEDDSYRQTTTLRYDDACKEHGSLDLEIETELDGETRVEEAHHTFEAAG